MFRHWASIFGLILLSIVFVDAGHPLWEASTKIKRAVPFDLNSPITTTWPEGIVPYCWANERARGRLAHQLRGAINLWSAAGLPETRFKFREMALEDCMRDRRNSLVIASQRGSLEYTTTVGKYVGPVDEIVPGPFANFNEEADFARPSYPSNTVAEKIAHEIGHIFGLYHEHQDPYFSTPNHRLFTLYCQHIEGYDQATADLTFDEIWGENGVCVNQHAALDHGFASAAHFLPMQELNYLPHPDRGPENEDVDWDSIMLYHSSVASKRGPGDHPHTIVKARGGRNYRIRIKRAPSRGDVRALIRLYDASETRPLPRLYHDPRSEYHTAFQNLQNFQVCDWPQGGPSDGGPSGG
ncbi:hypothetical protein N8T08_006360 [Aspergillus melleus]|uniref:Uncharacterized protein n=1 Tax=Aspergillus melleus TaxID=138277 RepID=A0ACC3B191_9EURO|nr:hypothetical protein N8T08_006360 [Aspergillus melleus]